MEKQIYAINHDVISFGPLGDKVDCVTGYLVTAMFIMLHSFSEKIFTGRKKNLSIWGQKTPGRFDYQSRCRFKAYVLSIKRWSIAQKKGINTCYHRCFTLKNFKACCNSLVLPE